jgi:hypothetical protein
VNNNGALMGYGKRERERELMCKVMGKAEGNEELWHGYFLSHSQSHVTALTVCPDYRRMGKELLSLSYTTIS